MKKWEKEILAKQIQSEEKVIERLEQTYEKAMDQVRDKLDILKSKPQTETVIFQKTYQQELLSQLRDIYDEMSGGYYNTIDDYLNECYEESFYGTLYGLHASGVPVTIPFNQEEVVAVTKLASDGIPLSQKLYQYTPDIVNKARQEISAGIATNSTYMDIARRLANRSEATVKQAIRIARTEGHRVNSEVTFMTMNKAKDLGADVIKQWDSTIDKRTRPSHMALDGQQREMDQPFKSPLNGLTAMYPAGFGVAKEDINCRCVILQRARWALDKSELDKAVGDLDTLTPDEMDALAQRLGVTKEELIKKSNGVVEADGRINHVVKANNYNDFKKKYQKKAKVDTAKLKGELDILEQDQKAFVDGSPFDFDQMKDEVVFYEKNPNHKFAISKDDYDEFMAKQTKINDLKLKLGLPQDDLPYTSQKSWYLKDFEDLNDQVNNFPNKTYSGIWKDDVSLLDYPAKKGSIQGKIDYFTDQLKNTTDPAKISQFKKALDDLDEFWMDGESLANLKKDLKEVEKKLIIPKPKPKGIDSGAFSMVRKQSAMNFTKKNDADKYFRPKLDDQWDNLTEYEKYSVWKYTENSNPLNKALSGYEENWERYNFKGVGKANWNHEDDWRFLGSTEFKRKFAKAGTSSNIDHGKAIESLTLAIEKTPFEDDVFLVRGSDTGGFAGLLEGDLISFDDARRYIDRGDIDDLRKIIENQEFTNHAFTSTGIASDAGFGGNIKYKIYAPKGTKGIYAEPQSYYGDTVSGETIYTKGKSYSYIGDEAEVIIQRGTKYRITAIEYKNGNVLVDMEVVEQPTYFQTGREETFNDGKTLHGN